MKVKASLEQGICILMLLAIQEQAVPLQSTLISQRLELSDSYTKKIVQRLAKAGLVRSVSGKAGGVVLNREPDQISMLDVFDAIEGTEPFGMTSGLADHVFRISDDPSFEAVYHIGKLDTSRPLGDVKDKALAVFDRAEQQFRHELANFYLESLCPHRDGKRITIDWTPWLTLKANEEN
ncbi:RrF2 family transcriptional regulator [Furfurilactobacillus entadae]|uniref:RrF2 family transcriptional regulator n=1 Tax=Furfurilactobacillus entadae TaxID=2922307 RepID=UPI0035ED8515